MPPKKEELVSYMLYWQKTTFGAGLYYSSHGRELNWGHRLDFRGEWDRRRAPLCSGSIAQLCAGRSL
jgi:hypothetical protein